MYTRGRERERERVKRFQFDGDITNLNSYVTAFRLYLSATLLTRTEGSASRMIPSSTISSKASIMIYKDSNKEVRM